MVYFIPLPTLSDDLRILVVELANAIIPYLRDLTGTSKIALRGLTSEGVSDVYQMLDNYKEDEDDTGDLERLMRLMEDSPREFEYIANLLGVYLENIDLAEDAYCSISSNFLLVHVN